MYTKVLFAGLLVATMSLNRAAAGEDFAYFMKSQDMLQALAAGGAEAGPTDNQTIKSLRVLGMSYTIGLVEGLSIAGLVCKGKANNKEIEEVVFRALADALRKGPTPENRSAAAVAAPALIKEFPCSEG